MEWLKKKQTSQAESLIYKCLLIFWFFQDSLSGLELAIIGRRVVA